MTTEYENGIDLRKTTQMIEEIIEDGNKPCSIREIKEKYQLNFPFSVRRVLPGPTEAYPVGSIIEVPGFEENKRGHWVVKGAVQWLGNKSYLPGIDFPHYVLWEY